ncbi:hypothetical protein DRQ16_03060 [bacterium]|nr:MAG: hypothetical protein DRQ16_03060 [bacterium]
MRVKNRRKRLHLAHAWRLRIMRFVFISSFFILILLGFAIYSFTLWSPIQKSLMQMGEAASFLVSAINGALKSLLLVFIAFLGYITVILFLLARQFIGPLVRLGKVMDDVAQRKYLERLRFRRTDEAIFHEIASDFNKILERIETDEALLAEALTLIVKGELEEARTKIKERLKLVRKEEK